MNKKQFFLQYLFYLIRWQLSTPILAGCIIFLSSYFNATTITIIANLIGGLIFFWIDKYIFKFKHKLSLWEVKEDIYCDNCHTLSRGYRLIQSKNYNADNKKPVFLCEKCSIKKSKQLKDKGVDL